LISSEGDELTYAIHLNSKSLNNEAEYEALLAGGVFVYVFPNKSKSMTNNKVEKEGEFFLSGALCLRI
jgi:hypothetical protein